MVRIGLLISLLAAWPAASALNVFACEPEWGALVKELAGAHVSLTVATHEGQDPHRLQARPSLIAATRNADLLVCTGADLEIGWLPLLLRRAGNAGVQPGQPGYFMAADFVRKLEVPVIVDRAQGDIHPQGNPHVHLDPGNLARVAKQLAQRLAALDPGNSNEYAARLEDFQLRWEQAADQWETRGEALRGLRLVTHHRSFSYLAHWLDLDIVGTLELKPGVPPSASHLAGLIERLSPDLPAAIIRTSYENERPSRWLSERLGVPALVLPYTVATEDGPANLFELFDQALAALEAVAQ